MIDLKEKAKGVSIEDMYRSTSQLTQYEQCPWAYKLQRIDKAHRRPAAWSAQGTAVHRAAEVWEISRREMTRLEVEAVFSETYDKELNHELERTPDLRDWFRSGGYGRTVEQDIERRYDLGLEQTGKLLDWYEKHPEDYPLLLDTGPAVEVPFVMDIGGVEVVGITDRIEHGRVVDIKTGKKAPEDYIQLKVQAMAARERGVPVHKAAYFMANTGAPTFTKEVSEKDEQEITKRFLDLDQNVKAGNFEPRPDPNTCKMCSVAMSCEFRAVDPL